LFLLLIYFTDIVSWARRYLYTLFAAMDGNFQLKGRDKAGGETDAGLGTGLCIVIDEKEHDEWCLKSPPIKQVWLHELLICSRAHIGCY
jgi:hypothetical protein